jgi:hypothetical protein
MDELRYSAVMEDTSKGMPQFATAEFALDSPAMICAACRDPITGPYFQINAAQVCPECTNKIQEQIPKDSHAAFVRALVFGIAGALVGFALYVIFALVTGLVIGVVSLAVTVQDTGESSGHLARLQRLGEQLADAGDERLPSEGRAAITAHQHDRQVGPPPM